MTNVQIYPGKCVHFKSAGYSSLSIIIGINVASKVIEMFTVSFEPSVVCSVVKVINPKIYVSEEDVYITVPHQYLKDMNYECEYFG